MYRKRDCDFICSLSDKVFLPPKSIDISKDSFQNQFKEPTCCSEEMTGE